MNLGGTLVCDEALRRGDIDVYVEYTGTALTALFNEPDRRERPRHVRRSAQRARACTPRAASRCCQPGLQQHLRDPGAVGRGARSTACRAISDLARVAGGWRAGFGYEFLERPDGFAGLARTYGLRFRDAPRVMDLNLIYRAVAAGEIDVTAGDATSGLIQALGLTVLEDDREYFPPYDAVPVVRAATLLRIPQSTRRLRGAGRPHLRGRHAADEP